MSNTVQAIIEGWRVQTLARFENAALRGELQNSWA